MKIQETALVHCDKIDDTTWARVRYGTAFCSVCGSTDHEEAR